jgi:hypothetical protein
MATSCIDILDQALLAQVVLTRKLSFPILLKRYVFILMSLESVRTLCCCSYPNKYCCNEEVCKSDISSCAVMTGHSENSL